jgi:hypothetical protein
MFRLRTLAAPARDALGAPPARPAAIDRASAVRLTPPLFTAISEVREQQIHNTVPVPELYAFAYHELYTRDAALKRLEQTALRRTLSLQGVAVDHLLTPDALAPYKKAVMRAFARAVTHDLAGIELGRFGRDAYEERTFLTSIDYAKAVAHRAFIAADSMNEPPPRLRLCITVVDERFSGPMPMIHAFVAFNSGDGWRALNPQSDLRKSSLEIFELGPRLPERFGRQFRTRDVPALLNKELLYAGAYDIRSPLIAPPMHPQVLMNVVTKGELSADEPEYVQLAVDF